MKVVIFGEAMITCPKCSQGIQPVDEDDVRKLDTCYFCCGEGQISDEQFRIFRLDQLIGELAVAAVESQWTDYSNEVAAELGVSPFQLKEDKVYNLGQSIAQEIHNLPPVVQDVLMDRFLGKVL